MTGFMKMLELEIPKWIERRAGMVGDDYITAFQAACFRVYVQYTTPARVGGTVRDGNYPAKFAREVGVLNVCRRRPLVAQALADAGYDESVRRVSIKRLSDIIAGDARSARMPARAVPPHLEITKGWDDLDLLELEDDLQADIWPELRSDEVFDNDKFSSELDQLLFELDAPVHIPPPFLL